MEAVVLVPGIMGTRLVLPGSATGADDEEVWPPTPLETKFGYERIDKLQDKMVVPTTIIDSILCYSFYSTIVKQIQDLGFTEEGRAKRFVPFPYDWRLDNFDTAELLAARLDALYADGARRIAIVAHSMGGLIARLVLESGAFDTRPWFGSVHLFAALATPHLGAPLAVARIFGVDATLGISGADFAKLASNRDFPSGYQLLPAPRESVVWVTNSPDVQPLDYYDDATARTLGMDPVLVGRARALHDTLAQGQAPAHVRYFYFAGVGHRTVTRVNVTVDAGRPVNHGKTVVTRTADAGDGTVPLYSALPRPAQRQLVVNEHATVFDGRPFRRVFYRLLGGDDGAAVESGLDAQASVTLALSLDQPVQPLGDDIEVTLKVVAPSTAPMSDTFAARTEIIEGRLVMEAVDEQGHLTGDPPITIPIAFRGPPIDRLTVYLPETPEPGLFRLSFEGSPPAPEPLAFAVSAA